MPSDAPLVSIVMATYNGARFLSEQLESILSQTYSNLEILVCDDGSTDQSFAILQKMASQDSRLKIRRNSKRLGVILNFLQAAHDARGELIGWSDQDDVWLPQKISRLVERLQADPRTMLVCSDLRVCDEQLREIQPSFWRQSGFRPVAERPDERVFFKNPAPGCSMLFRRAVLEKMNAAKPGTAFMHDHLTLLVSAGLGQIDFTDQSLVLYRQHALNVIGSQAVSAFDEAEFLNQLRLRIDYFENNFGGEGWFDCSGLRDFCARYARQDRRIGNFKDLKYYRAMHPDGLKYGLMGAVKCIFPQFIRWFKTKKNGEQKV